ncbi:hypothetical protein [Halorientalis pallida]|uniref:Uncharacterized protein n=1 Tax=Halorientalis pallida TaxID=2479928 RepID=A0A498L2N4_9EURY|nr:hypothetical protein [Halorientalis pallida]RXK48031.1 hypothetical protein EAF64_15495 [Halorientalis pallida]
MELCDPSHEKPFWPCRLDHDKPAVVLLSENIDYAATLARVRLLDTFDTQGVDPFGGPLIETPAPPILFSSMVLERLQHIFEHKQLRERKDHHDEDAYQSSRTPSEQRHLRQFTDV